MQTRKIALCAVLIGALCCSGSYVLGQQNAAPDDAAKFLELHERAKVDTEQLDPLFDAYAKLPGDGPTTKQAARIAWVESKTGDNSTFEIVQTMQNQKIIEQNERIIALLEKNTKK